MLKRELRGRFCPTIVNGSEGEEMGFVLVW